ncbi:fido domain-containing protein [Lasiosphaeris hirsuta]|uniref:Fido domain-containing protein n=1 Tax=Lasiosphaeris hirsuta TaxID=260670 RepID=A0AA40DI53_9PEZI|nr:fido domain-containing protein [Lasiosphaeris hirsuta]
MRGLSGRLAGTFSSGWPSWRSVHGGAAPNFTIRLAASLEKEALELNLPADPATIIADARKTSQRQGVSAFPQVREALEQSLIILVYGSNMIETAGSNLRITFKLCRAIFRGELVEEIINERDPEYKKGDHTGVTRSRKEVIQHAKALSFIIDHVILDNEPISEALILETHHISYSGMGDDDEVTPGKYREHEVAVSYSKPGETKRKVSRCIRASAVPKYMKDLVGSLNQEINEAERTGNMDPYTLAARFHHQFVMVHPFGDGNGRMSRIIMNVLLLEYAGHVTLFGSEETEKDDYLDIVGRGRKVFEKEDMEFARFVLAKSRSGLEQMLTWARREGNDHVSE